MTQHRDNTFLQLGVATLALVLFAVFGLAHRAVTERPSQSTAGGCVLQAADPQTARLLVEQVDGRVAD